MTSWAVDLGTTNTGVARWDAVSDRPQLIDLPGICRDAQAQNPLEAPRLVPSATLVLEPRDLASRLGRRGFFARRFFMGRQGLIGRPALEADEVRRTPAFVPSFKPFLEREARRTLARAGGTSFSARDVARIYLRELFAEVKRVTGERIRDAVVTSPIEAFESYRGEVAAIGRWLGVKRLRFVDEPVAAALGYGLGIDRPRTVMVFDFGGGTMHVALARLAPRAIEQGACEVLAKEGRAVGGRDVDRWFLTALCAKAGLAMPPDDEASAPWRRALVDESCRVKEQLFFRERETFRLPELDDLRAVEARLRGGRERVELGRDELSAVLRERGLYTLVEAAMEGAMARGREQGAGDAEVDDVLMVGGSSLLPGLYGIFERRFGRDRVRAFQPFEAVAHGGCVFAAGAFARTDFIVHDYAFVTHDAKTLEPQHTVVVPRGTRFPTPPGYWKRQLVPTCSLGEPETLFKLVVCEIGEAGRGGERSFAFDASGKLHKLGPGDEKLVVPLNESNPTLGHLDPPHAPDDRRPRLELGFEVNGERWLCATVVDLKTRKVLMKAEPVVRLL